MITHVRIDSQLLNHHRQDRSRSLVERGRIYAPVVRYRGQSSLEVGPSESVVQLQFQQSEYALGPIDLLPFKQVRIELAMWTASTAQESHHQPKHLPALRDWRLTHLSNYAGSQTPLGISILLTPVIYRGCIHAATSSSSHCTHILRPTHLHRLTS